MVPNGGYLEGIYKVYGGYMKGVWRVEEYTAETILYAAEWILTCLKSKKHFNNPGHICVETQLQSGLTATCEIDSCNPWEEMIACMSKTSSNDIHR